MPEDYLQIQDGVSLNSKNIAIAEKSLKRLACRWDRKKLKIY